MKKQLFFTLSLLFTLLIGFAQKTQLPPKVNSLEIIKNAQSSEFEDATKALLTIPLGDTLYNNAQLMLGQLYMENEQLENAIKHFTWIVEHPNSKVDKYAVNVSIADWHMLQEEFNTAIFYYQKALEKFPYNSMIHNAISECYFQLHQLAEAEEYSIRAISYNPFSATLHHRLGKIYLAQRKTIPALLALNFATYCAPSHETSIASLQTLEAIYANGISNYYDNNNIPAPKNATGNERFQEIEIMLNGNYALSSGFKPISKIKHIIPLQNQLLFSMLPTPEKSHNIIDHFYIPIFKHIVENDYNTFCYYQLQSTNVDNGKVLKKAEKMSNNIQKFINESYRFALAQATTGIGSDKDNQSPKIYEYDYDGALSAFGDSRTEVDGKFQYNGVWDLLNTDGSLNFTSEVKNNVSDGKTIIYYNSQPLEIILYKDGKLDGLAKRFFTEDPKKLELQEYYKDGNINGERIRKNLYGVVTEHSFLKENYYEGTCLKYSNQGALIDSTNYTDGSINSFSYTFYENGKPETQYDKQLSGNTLKNFHPDGSIYNEGDYVDGVMVGNYKSYFPNGKLETVGNLNEIGQLDGYWTAYYRNGEVKTESHYENNAPTGEMHHYLPSQFKTHTQLWKEGKIIEVITYLPDGSVREKVKPVNNQLTYDIYDGNGTKIAHICTDEENDASGNGYSCFSNGNVRTNQLIIDSTRSKNTYYNISGNITREVITNGMQTETYDYYNNGKLRSYGIYQEDTPIGTHYEYCPEGNLLQSIVFDEGEPLFTKMFFRNGMPDLEVERKFGNIRLYKSFDLNGKIIKIDTLVNGMGTIKIFLPNGKVGQENHFFANVLHGKSTTYNIDGQVIESKNYINGKRDGERKVHFENGQLQIKENYILGKQNGWRHIYNEDGVLVYKSYFENGNMEDTAFSYSELGKLSISTCYLDGEPNGPTTYYSGDEKPACILHYEEGRLNTYQFMQKNGEWSPVIPFTNDTVVITAFYPNGKTSLEMEFYKRARTKRTVFYADGKTQKEIFYQNDEPHGSDKSYYPNGNIHTLQQYVDGYSHGEETYYYPNGKIKAKNNYKYGQQDGEQIRYNEKGEQIFSTTYKDGIKIK